MTSKEYNMLRWMFDYGSNQMQTGKQATVSIGQKKDLKTLQEIAKKQYITLNFKRTEKNNNLPVYYARLRAKGAQEYLSYKNKEEEKEVKKYLTIGF